MVKIRTSKREWNIFISTFLYRPTIARFRHIKPQNLTPRRNNDDDDFCVNMHTLI